MWRKFFQVPSNELYGYIGLAFCLIVLLVVVQIFDSANGKRRIEISQEAEYEPPRTYAEFADDTLHINTASVTQLSNFGFRYYSIVNIAKYRENGGFFRNAEELKTIRGIDTVLVNSRDSAKLIAYDFDNDEESYKWQRKHYYTSYYKKEYKRNSGKKGEPRDKKISLFYSELDELPSLGVDPTVVDSIAAYRERYTLSGSVSLSTLQKANSQTIRSIIEPNITAEKRKYGKTEYTKPEKKKVEINSAGREELESVKGIGSYLSQAIVERRKRLGGFVDAEQLLEISGMHEDHFPAVIAQITVDTTLVKKIAINSASEKAMAQHPYIGSDLARKIAKRRNRHAIRNDAEFRAICDGYEVSEYLTMYVDYTQKK